MDSYSQRDPRWSAKRLGKSTLTMGRYGCTTTCIADLSTYFGDNINPGKMVDTIKYTADGLVIWDSCKFKGFRFERRERKRDDTNILLALAHPDRAVILQVDNGAHWVVATAYDKVNKVYKIADPWLGDRSTMKRYKNSITGAAYFRR